MDLAALHSPDLVILDLAMPGTNGLEVCRQLRSWSSVPIIVLSVRDAEEEKIRALDAGADDYLTKPFGVGELLARIRAVLRRSRSEETEEPAMSVNGLHIDFVRRLVTLEGVEIHLTPKEYDLLCYMVKNPNRVLTHRQLLTKVWGPEFVQDTHTLRVHIANLRNKIERQPERPRFVHTETRIGYRFRTESTREEAGSEANVKLPG